MKCSQIVGVDKIRNLLLQDFLPGITEDFAETVIDIRPLHIPVGDRHAHQPLLIIAAKTLFAFP